MDATTAGGAATLGTRAGPRLGTLRSGIIGAGFIGQVHARAVRAAGGRLVAVADASPEGVDVAAARLGAEWAAPSAEALINSPDVDVVHICTPNFLHARLARAALDAGKHVICEKPLATTPEDADALADAARAGSSVAAVPFVYRYYPSVREARGRLADGATGPVHLIHGSYLQDWLSSASAQNWRVDPALGGASRTFADIGVHWCDLVEFVTGHRITSLCARLTTTVPERTDGTSSAVVTTEDAATLVFATDRGAIGSVVVSQVSPGRKNRLWFSIDAADASLSFDQESPETLWVGARDGVQLVQRGVGNTADAQRFNHLPAGHPQGFQDCFTALVSDVYAAARGERPVGLPSFEDGARAARITAAVLESAASRAWVGVA
jgi:predicted dehydrogenase